MSLGSASSLIALQVLSRGGTFVLNQALVRLASPTAFGAAAIQFELVLSTILFLSREGVRTALLRAPHVSPSAAAARRANTAFLPVLVGVPLALATALLYARLAGAEVQAQPHFPAAVALYALAAVLELLSEPLYNLAMTTLQTGVRVRAEGLGIAVKSLATFAVLFYDHRRGAGTLALVAFAAGQLAYSLVVFATYVALLGAAHMRPTVPPPEKENTRRSWKAYLDAQTVQLAGTLTLQSVVKHFLTEADKLLLAAFSPLRDQGGYAIAVNYGSLVARILFQPIEETLRLFFSRLLPSTSAPSTSARAQALATLHALLAAQAAASLVLLAFAPPYLPLALPLLLPRAYLATSAPAVLAAWVWYVPVLALNGGLEAFVASVARTGELNAQSRWMVLFSGVYVAAALVLRRAGAGDAGLVYANIAALAVRIAYALRFVAQYFRAASAASSTSPSPASPTPPTPADADKSTSATRPPSADLHFAPRALLPPPTFLLALALARILIALSARRLNVVEIATALGRGALLDPRVLLHVLLGGALAGACVGVWWVAAGRGVVRRAWRAKAA